MKTKLLTLFVALIATTALWAQNNVITYKATRKLYETTRVMYNQPSSQQKMLPNREAGLDINAFNVAITSHEFSNGTGTITFAGEVTTIGSYAFFWCSELTSITIPNSVTGIGSNAFLDCSGLTSITCYAENPPGCGSDCFRNVPKDIPIYIPYNASLGAYKSAKGWKEFTNIITMYFDVCGEDLRWEYERGTLSISGTGEMFDFTQTNSPWLDLKDSVTHIVFPSNITSIGKEAFYDFLKLTSITCYAENPPICGEKCFYNVPKNISLYLPYNIFISGAYQSAKGWKDFTNIIPMYSDDVCGEDLHWKYKDGTLSISGTGDMYDCTQTASPWSDLKDSVTNIVFPSNITSIGKYAFYGFSKLTSVTIPNSVTTIGNGAFRGCSGLTSPLYNANYFAYMPESYSGAYTIPDGIKQIVDGAFSSCNGLTSVTIPNSVTTIGDSAFADCTYLTDVVLGANVTDIGCFAFAGDFRLENITCYALLTPNVCNTTFSGINKYAVYLYVPESAQRKYQVDPNWSGFSLHLISAEKKPIDGENSVVTPTDQDVTITWPITEGTDTYTLTITKNGETICVLTFNAQGQLTNIAFAAPGRDGAHQALAATLTAQGYQFTVTGLTPGTAYNYSVTATNAGGQTIAEHNGNFSTTGGESGLQNVRNGAKASKYFHDGNLIIERNGIKYTPAGQKVR